MCITELQDEQMFSVAYIKDVLCFLINGERDFLQLILISVIGLIINKIKN